MKVKSKYLLALLILHLGLYAQKPDSIPKKTDFILNLNFGVTLGITPFDGLYDMKGEVNLYPFYKRPIFIFSCLYDYRININNYILPGISYYNFRSGAYKKNTYNEPNGAEKTILANQNLVYTGITAELSYRRRLFFKNGKVNAILDLGLFNSTLIKGNTTTKYEVLDNGNLAETGSYGDDYSLNKINFNYSFFHLSMVNRIGIEKKLRKSLAISFLLTNYLSLTRNPSHYPNKINPLLTIMLHV